VPSIPLPNAAITLLRYAANWDHNHFNPADEQPMMPVLLRVDQEGDIQGMAIPQLRPQDKPKLERIIQQSMKEYQATAFVTEMWLSIPKAGKSLAEGANFPRCDPERREVVAIRLLIGSREILWHNEIRRHMSARERLQGWKIIGDSAAGFRLVTYENASGSIQICFKQTPR
jgi:hypothetical protein